MRNPNQLRIAALLGALASLVFGLLLAFGVYLLFGSTGTLGFDRVNPAGIAEGVVFVLGFVTALRYARSAMRIPSPTLLSFGLVAPPPVRAVAAEVPIVDAAQSLHTIAENRMVIVQEAGVPIGVTGLRRDRITSWEELVKVDGGAAVTDLRRLLAHEPLVVVLDSDEIRGVVTQEMYLGGLWGSVR